MAHSFHFCMGTVNTAASSDLATEVLDYKLYIKILTSNVPRYEFNPLGEFHGKL